MHSYLDDGPAMQFSHYGGYLGWAALELYAVEGLIGARLAHCYGGLVPEPDAPRDRRPRARRPARRRLARLDDLRQHRRVRAATASATSRCSTTSVMIDVATQLHRPTGHAINPVPLSEAERIPDAAEILEVHLIARELEREVRRGARAARLGVGRAPRGRGRRATRGRSATGSLAQLRRRRASTSATPPRCCSRCGARTRRSSSGASASPPRASCARWRRGSTASSRASPSARGARSRGSTACAIVLAALEVHDVVRDALARELPQAGAQVIVLPSSVSPAQVARGRRRRGRATPSSSPPTTAARSRSAASSCGARCDRRDATVIFGGVLNEDDGGPLPVDARPGLDGARHPLRRRDRAARRGARLGSSPCATWP